MASSAVLTASSVLSRLAAEQEIQTYKTEGYVLLKNLISREQAETLRAEVMDIMSKIGLSMSKLRQTHEYLEGGALDQLVNSPDLCSVAGQLMEGPSSLYLPFSAVKSGGGGGRFHFHQDNQYTKLDGPACNLWFALTAMRYENGCLQIVPKSHLNGTLESVESGDGDTHRKVTWEPTDFVTINMEPGDCVAFTRLTVHGSGINSTPDPRVAYAIQFHRNDVRWYDKPASTWKLLTEHPRWKVGPVKEITVPKGKVDGH